MTWREFQRHLDEYRALLRRIDAMDKHGTRGVGTLQATVTMLAKSLNGVKADIREWRAEHETEHETEARQRVYDRRWRITAAIAALAAVATVIGMLAALLTHAGH